MASTYSTTLGIELMVTGEKSGQWGTITNTNLNIIEQAVGGYLSKSIAGGAQTTALTITDGSLGTSEARNFVIELTGTITGNQIVTVPDGIEKNYIVRNNTTGAFTVQFKTVSGAGPTFSTTDKGTKVLYTDGTDVVDVMATSSQINLVNQNELRFEDATGGQYIGLKAGTTVSSSTTFTLPTADGTTGQVLQTNGSGDLSFTDLPAGFTTGKAIAMAIVFG